MSTDDDKQLLNSYIDSRSESAFRALVDRHLDLVHSVARRVTLNDDLARDVTQSVFLKLATRPDDVPKSIQLLAWLHRTTRHKAIDLVRSENRRHRREQIASQLQQHQSMETQEPDWKEIEPVIDAALEQIPDDDRTLILARYYKNQSHLANAHSLGISEDAARMRTNRALEKLRTTLSKRGIVTTAALLGSVVSSHAVTASPGNLSANISANALAGAATASSGVAFTMAKIASIIAAIPVIIFQFNQNADLQSEATALRENVETIQSPAPRLLKSPKALESGQSLSRVLKTPDPSTRLSALLEYVSTVDAKRIPAVIARLRELTPDWDPEAKMATQVLFTRWGRSDTAAAFAYLEGRDYQTTGSDTAFALGALAADDPQQAISWLSDPDNKLAHLPWMGDILAGAVAKEWVRQDPEAAFQWAQTVPIEQRRGALSGVLETIAANDPTHAVTLAATLPASHERDEIIEAITTRGIEQDPFLQNSQSQPNP
jgi:RNA polymerase sigma factor (sigma-70 family)